MGGLSRIFSVLAWPFLLAGVGAFGLGGWVLYEEFTRAKDLQAIAEAPQPRAVTIEAFDPATDIHPAGEVHVMGQLDLSMQYDLVAPSRNSADHVGVMIPIYPYAATDTRGPALGLLLYDQGAGGDTIGETEISTLVAQIDGEGAVGPYISVAGLIANAGRYRPLVFDAFAENERAIAADFLTIAPFRAGRTTDLHVSANLEQPMIFGGGGTIAVLLAMIGFSRSRSLKIKGVQLQSDATATPVPISSAPEGADDVVETGLVIISAYSPEMADGSTGAGLMRDVLALGRRADETEVYTARREGMDDFEALDSGGLKRPLAGRAMPKVTVPPKPVTKESPLAAKQDTTQAADIMAAVQAEISSQAAAPRSVGEAGDIFTAVQAAMQANGPEKTSLDFSSPNVGAARHPVRE